MSDGQDLQLERVQNRTLVIPPRPPSMGGIILQLVLIAGFSFTLILAPFVYNLPILAMGISVGFGVLSFLIGVYVTALLRFYMRASANLAFVRTGLGGTVKKKADGTTRPQGRVILDGGTFVLPGFHEVVWVNLETFRINVTKKERESLLTNDNIRIEIDASFFLKVQPESEDILNAARSLGSKLLDPEKVKPLIQEKLDSALRTVAATKAFMELHSKRDDFLRSVLDIVALDLKQNGLTLESATISRFEQADPKHFSRDNILDAQGAKKIAEITQRALVEKNMIERDAEREIKEKDVSTNEGIRALELKNAQIEAENARDVAMTRVERDREKSVFEIEQSRKVKEFQINAELEVAKRQITKEQEVQSAEVEKVRIIEEARIKQELAVEKANRDRQIELVKKIQEQEQAEVLKAQAVEAANRERERMIALKDAEKLEAEAKAASAMAAKEEETQKIKTVEVKSEAERNAQRDLIAAKMEIEKTRIKDQTSADIQAYTRLKMAEAEAEAAKKQAEAILTKAKAEKDAQLQKAEGLRASELVPVEIDRERVKVEQQRVNVQREDLKNKQEYSAAALDFEKVKLQIEAQREVQIALAESMGKMLSSAKMEIFGDASAVEKIMESYLRSAGLAKGLQGFLDKSPIDVTELAGQAMELLKSKMNAQPTAEEKSDKD